VPVTNLIFIPMVIAAFDGLMEKQLATRQLNIKATESKSWFTILKKTLIKYDFSNINELVAKPPKKSIGALVGRDSICLSIFFWNTSSFFRLICFG
jgi:hypothetical protein